MIDALQTILLVFITWFIVTQRSGGSGLAGLFGAKRRKIILDSCALIDGRIVEIVNNGFVADELVIPQFILNELQTLADGRDSHKRERARFGLDIAHQLQDTAPVTVTIDRTVLAEVKAIDDKLVRLARKLKAQLYTTDYNLGKVAAVEGVQVLNVNELAQGLRPVSLPGETLSIKIVQRGSNRDQGVGYLEDGTMIVVDGAARHVNQTVPVTVTRMHQTVAGKMVFGQVSMKEVHEAQERRGEVTRTKDKEASTGQARPAQPTAQTRTQEAPATKRADRAHGLSGRLKALRHRPKIQ